MNESAHDLFAKLHTFWQGMRWGLTDVERRSACN
jgi:hypothetical protein